MERNGVSEAQAIGHAWTEFKRQKDGSIVIEINEMQAVRISLKYRDSGPYLMVETRRGGTGETMGACLRAAGMAQQFKSILQAHNDLGDLLGASRSFLLREEAKERAPDTSHMSGPK